MQAVMALFNYACKGEPTFYDKNAKKPVQNYNCMPGVLGRPPAAGMPAWCRKWLLMYLTTVQKKGASDALLTCVCTPAASCSVTADGMAVQHVEPYFKVLRHFSGTRK